MIIRGFPGDLTLKNLPARAEDMGLILGSVRSPGEGNGNPFQCLCLGNHMDKGAWQVTVYGVSKVRHNLMTKTTTLIIRSFSIQFSSVTQSYPTHCDAINCSTPGHPVHHHLPEFTQNHVH